MFNNSMQPSTTAYGTFTPEKYNKSNIKIKGIDDADEYTILSQTIIPGYGKYLQELLNYEDPMKLFVNLTIDVYLSSLKREINYKDSDGKRDIAAILNDTTEFYGSIDIACFVPLLSMYDHYDRYWNELLDLNYQLVEATLVFTGEEYARQKKPLLENIASLFGVEYSTVVPTIDRKLVAWPTLYGPLLWIWIHTMLCFDYSKIDFNYVTFILKYLNSLILCGECAEHWRSNKELLNRYLDKETLTEAEQKELAIIMIRFHNTIRVLYSTSNKLSYTSEIRNLNIVDGELIYEEPTKFENYLYMKYRNFAASILEKKKQHD